MWVELMKTATRQTSREGPHQTVPLTVRTATGKQLIQMGFTARSRLETAMQLAPARHDRAAICIAPAEGVDRKSSPNTRAKGAIHPSLGPRPRKTPWRMQG